MASRLARALLLALLLAASPAMAADRWFVTSDGVRLHYTETGRGPTVVLVPGWTMPGWIWDRQVAALSREWRVIAFDPRSQGQSQIAPDGHEPFRRADDIAELLRELGPTQVLLVGWSLGVLDVLAYIHTHGDGRVAGLVLVDNSVGEDPPPSASAAQTGVRRHGRVPSRAEQMRAFVRGMFRRPQPAAFIDRLTEACLRTPPGAAAALLAYPLPRTYWKEAIYATGRPVLYVVTPRLAGQAENLRARHPNAEAVVLRDVGHALFIDDAPGFNALVQGFVRRRVWRP